jgi:hypothetical protein
MPRVLIKHICATSAFISHVFATWRQFKISINLLAIPHWRKCMWTQMLCCCHSIVFGAQFTCISTAKNVHVNLNALLLPRYCVRCSIYVHFHGEECACELKCSAPPTLLLPVFNHSVPASSYLCCWRLVCSPWSANKKTLAWMRDFAWQPNFPTDCRRVSTNVILHPVGVSLRPFVSPVT